MFLSGDQTCCDFREIGPNFYVLASVIDVKIIGHHHADCSKLLKFFKKESNKKEKKKHKLTRDTERIESTTLHIPSTHTIYIKVCIIT